MTGETLRPEHRNALGYVVSDRTALGRYGEAGIVFGRRADGTRVSIDHARRGASEHLKCECGADLVARKGNIYIHHFAHAAGGGRECKLAQMRAVSLFACEALTEAGRLLLPTLRGTQRTVEVAEVKEHSFGECAGLVVTAVKGSTLREIAVIFTLKKSDTPPSFADFAAMSLSAIKVELASLKNMPDAVIARGIVAGVHRRWLYNDRHPDAVTEQDVVELSAAPLSMRSIREHPSIRAAPLISEDEWKTLSPIELRRRLFGNKYDP